MEFSKEILEQIDKKREDLKAKQVEMQTLLEETQKEIALIAEDVEACEHLLARCNYTKSTTAVEQGYVATAIGADTTIPE